MSNIAYVDGQNLHMGTTHSNLPWKVDLKRLRVYLEQKYNVEKAYYYLGYVQEDGVRDYLYEEIQAAGFILIFRQHTAAMLGTKKGNVDSDIIFSIMRRLCENETFDKIVLVSGDGDYKNLIDYLIEKDRFEKVLFPDGQKASSLLKRLGHQYFDSLSAPNMRNKIEKKKRGP